jgi:hypothetical protein
MTDEERLQAQRDMEASATTVDRNTELKLLELMDLAATRRPDPDVEQAYEKLRNELTVYLAKSGPRYFIDRDGFKHYAFSVTPEPLEINVERLHQMVVDGQLSMRTFKEVTVTKIIPEKFKVACNAGRISSQQLVDVAKTKKGTAHVKFSRPLG